nr:prepilin-type N-terminal cleavage/methylation domain-containing protein [uncultured Tolumonas sp.]
MKRSAGFTLIELIIVIVILGILAVTAAPKFINLQGDARTSTVNGLKGAVQAASSMAYSKAIIAGQDKVNPGTVTINGTSVALVYGYPAATSAGIALVIDASSAEWTGSGTGPYYLTPAGMTSGSGATCAVVYTLNASPAAPTTTAITTGC